LGATGPKHWVSVVSGGTQAWTEGSTGVLLPRRYLPGAGARTQFGRDDVRRETGQMSASCGYGARMAPTVPDRRVGAPDDQGKTRVGRENPDQPGLGWDGGRSNESLIPRVSRTTDQPEVPMGGRPSCGGASGRRSATGLVTASCISAGRGLVRLTTRPGRNAGRNFTLLTCPWGRRGRDFAGAGSRRYEAAAGHRWRVARNGVLTTTDRPRVYAARVGGRRPLPRRGLLATLPRHTSDPCTTGDR